MIGKEPVLEKQIIGGQNWNNWIIYKIYHKYPRKQGNFFIFSTVLSRVINIQVILQTKYFFRI